MDRLIGTPLGFDEPDDGRRARAIKTLVRKTVKSLQGMKESNLQSGPDSGLTDLWDEICVQIQGEESVLWPAYLDTVRAVLFRHCENAPSEDLKLIDGDGDPAADPEGGGGIQSYPCVEDIVETVMERVLWEAAEWSNHRIERFLERGSGI